MTEPRTFTIAEAAEATGLTVKALRNRCDRGQLRFLVKGGVRRIPLVELRRANLLAGGGDELQAEELDAGAEPRELVNRELLAELAKAHETIGELRALETRIAQEERELRQELAIARAAIGEELDRADAAERELDSLRRRGIVSRILNR